MLDSYRQEDAQQILQLAIARQVESEDLTRTQLFEIAAELGISPTDLQIAEQDWLSKRGELQEQQAFNLFRRSKFRQHLSKYLIVNAFLVLLALVTTGGIGWSIYVILGWGVFLALDAWKAYQTQGDTYESAFQRWRRQRQIKRSVNNLLDRWLKA